MADKDSRLGGAKTLGLPARLTNSVGRNDLDDLYRFSTAGRSSLSLSVSGIKRKTNIDVELYRLKRSASQVLKSIGKADFRTLKSSQRNANFQLVSASRAGSNKSESIQVGDLAAGDYFIRVYERTGDSKYTLAVNSTPIVAPPNGGTGGSTGGNTGGTNGNSGGNGTGNNGSGNGGVTNPPTPPAPGNSIATAFSASVPTSTALAGNFSTSDPIDYYKFTPTDSGDYLFNFTGAGEVDILDSDGTTPLKAATGSTSSGKFIEPLQQGKQYFIKLSQGNSGSTSYSLSVGNKLSDQISNSEANATALTLGTTAVTKQNYVVDKGISSPDDYYTFTVSQPGTLTGRVDGLFGKLNVQIYTTGQAKDKIPTYSSAAGANAESFSGSINAGTYFVHVLPGGTAEGSQYNLSLTLTPTAGSPAVSRQIRSGALADPGIKGLAQANGVVYFGASDDQGINALWRSDGTLNGTEEIKPFNTINFTPGNFATVTANNSTTLYFTADDGKSGSALWKSDGTAAGTTQVSDPSGLLGTGYSPSKLTVVGDRLYFIAKNRLFRTNVAGTGIEEISTSGSSNADMGSAARLTASSDTLYFTAPDQGNIRGIELWRVQNSSSNLQVADLNSGSNSSSADNITPVGNALFVVAKTGTGYRKLVRVDSSSFGDPTKDSTTSITVFQPPATYAPDGTTLAGDFTAVSNLVTDGTNLYFNGTTGGYGIELWKLSNAATAAKDDERQITDINPSFGDSSPSNLVILSSNLYFFANDGTQTGLYTIAGGTGNAAVVSLGNTPPTNPSSLTVAGSSLYFTGSDSNRGTELWKYSPSQSSGDPVTPFDINKTPAVSGQNGDFPDNSSNPSLLTNVNGKLFFVANDGVNGNQLWTVRQTVTSA